jgi:hypothetical protein
VNEDFFKEGELAPCLAARVELPLGATITVKEKSCKGTVTLEGSTVEHPVVGEATVEVKVTEKRFERIDVGVDEDGKPVVLQPADTPKGRLLKIKIVSIIRGQLKMPGCETNMPPVAEGTPINHVQAYYHLLGNRCGKHPGGGPVVRAGKGGGNCPGFINPYQCTLGTGG